MPIEPDVLTVTTAKQLIPGTPHKRLTSLWIYHEETTQMIHISTKNDESVSTTSKSFKVEPDIPIILKWPEERIRNIPFYIFADGGSITVYVIVSTAPEIEELG